MYNLLMRRRALLNLDNSSAPIDPYVLLPFTMEILYDGTVWFFGKTPLLITSFKYSLNGGSWTNVDLTKVFGGSLLLYIEVSAGDILLLIGVGQFGNSSTPTFEIEYSKDGNAAYGGEVNLSGNIMSLIGGDNFINCTSVPDYCFYDGILTLSTDYIIRDITNLRMSATEVGDYAFYRSFAGQQSLTGSAVNLCPNLTTVGNYGFRQAFNGCIFLTEPAYIPATDIGTGCYYGMYTGCNRLLYAPDLPATILKQDCYRQMFSNCTNIVTAGEIAATTLATTCCRLMFNNCSKLEIAPVLHATTLASNCYYRLFYGCSKLKYIKAMFTTTPSTSYTNGWVTNVASSGTFVKNSSATWNVTGTSGIPSGWTVQTASS